MAFARLKSIRDRRGGDLVGGSSIKTATIKSGKGLWWWADADVDVAVVLPFLVSTRFETKHTSQKQTPEGPQAAHHSPLEY